MRKQKFSWVKVALLLTISITYLSCSSSLKDETIISKVKESLNNKVPMTWQGAHNPVLLKLDGVEIVQRGIYNKERDYFPVRVRIRGKCHHEIVTIGRYPDLFRAGIYYTTEVKDFDQIFNFVFYKDDYNEWQCSVDTIQMQ